MTRFFKGSLIALALLAALSFTPSAQGQISFGLSIGSAPACPYGYYDYSPYRCAPYGYYGSEWFSNGAFVGAGPWYRGPARFYGHVDHRYDPRFGYRGRYPVRGERFDNRRDFHDFHGNSFRDGRGHEQRGGGQQRGGGGRDRR